MLNASYGFNEDEYEDDTARIAGGSDYAKSQGLLVNADEDSSFCGNSSWHLRSAGLSSDEACSVDSDGYVDDNCETDHTGVGIRPALNFNPESDIFQSEVAEFASTEINIDEGNSNFKFDKDKKNLYSASKQTAEQIIAATGGKTQIVCPDGKTAKAIDKIASGMKVVLKDKDGKILDEKTIIVLGDVGGDGDITAADARLALRASVGLENLNEWQTLAANIDDNPTAISAADARLILRASVGLETLNI